MGAHPQTGVLGSWDHTPRLYPPLIHVGGPEHQKSTPSTPGPEAQLSEQISDDHPHPSLEDRGDTSACTGHRAHATAPTEGSPHLPRENRKVKQFGGFLVLEKVARVPLCSCGVGHLHGAHVRWVVAMSTTGSPAAGRNLGPRHLPPAPLTFLARREAATSSRDRDHHLPPHSQQAGRCVIFPQGRSTPTTHLTLTHPTPCTHTCSRIHTRAYMLMHIHSRTVILMLHMHTFALMLTHTCAHSCQRTHTCTQMHPHTGAFIVSTLTHAPSNVHICCPLRSPHSHGQTPCPRGCDQGTRGRPSTGRARTPCAPGDGRPGSERTCTFCRARFSLLLPP